MDTPIGNRNSFMLYLILFNQSLCFWRDHNGNQSRCSLLKSYELRVQIYELRVQIFELRVQIHELQVQIQELRVQIHELEH